jgi:hypothetical protein
MKTSPPPSTHPAGKHASLLSREGANGINDNRKQTKPEEDSWVNFFLTNIVSIAIHKKHLLST